MLFKFRSTFPDNGLSLLCCQVDEVAQPRKGILAWAGGFVVLSTKFKLVELEVVKVVLDVHNCELVF